MAITVTGQRPLGAARPLFRSMLGWLYPACGRKIRMDCMEMAKQRYFGYLKGE